MVGNRVANGQSMGDDVRSAAEAAAQQALARLDEPASFGLLFAGPEHDLGEALRCVRQVTSLDHLIGCSTAGEVTEAGLVHGSITVVLVSTPRSSVITTYAPSLSDPLRVAETLVQEFTVAADLESAVGRSESCSFLLIDSLSGGGETLVEAFADGVPSGRTVVGGAAGDELRFETATVGARGTAGAGGVALLHVFGQKRVGVGVGHGLRARTTPMRVTRAEGNVLYEVEGRPAFEMYRRFAAEQGVSLTPEDAGTFMIKNELGLFYFDDVVRSRAPLRANSDGSLVCAASVPEGALITILGGEVERMISAAASAARIAEVGLAGAKPAGVLLFDCVARGMILEQDFQREIDAVREVFPDVPLTGFLTYGEIALQSGVFDGWHNATAVVVALPE